MKKPPAAALALALGLIPFIGMCFTAPLWDRATPLVLGLPFNMFWLLAWIVVSSGCLALANRVWQKQEKQGHDQ